MKTPPAARPSVAISPTLRPGSAFPIASKRNVNTNNGKSTSCGPTNLLIVRCPAIVGAASRRFQIVGAASRRFQVISAASRRFQVVGAASRRFRAAQKSKQPRTTLQDAAPTNVVNGCQILVLLLRHFPSPLSAVLSAMPPNSERITDAQLRPKSIPCQHLRKPAQRRSFHARATASNRRTIQSPCHART